MTHNTRLTDRDLHILAMINKFGAMTTFQIAGLFNMHVKVCQRRLRKLAYSDYVRYVCIPSVKGRNPHLFYFGGRSLQLLGLSSSKPRLTLQLSHQMKNTDVLIGIINSLKASRIQCHVLPEHVIRKALQDVIPDGAFMIEKDDRSALFLFENCAGTEIIRSASLHQDIESKIIRYTEMFEDNRVGFYEEYFQCSFNRFRLLYVADGVKRLDAVSRVIAEHDRHGFVWMTTLSELKGNGICNGIWHVPAIGKPGQSII